MPGALPAGRIIQSNAEIPQGRRFQPPLDHLPIGQKIAERNDRKIMAQPVSYTHLDVYKRQTLSYSLGELNPLQYQTAYQNITEIRKILLRIHQNQSADTDW